MTKPERDHKHKHDNEKHKPEHEHKFKAEHEHKFKADKEFEKVKSDKELEKVKSDKEFEKVKLEKELKLEAKEVEKPIFEKLDKEVAENVDPGAPVVAPAEGFDVATLLAHAEGLEQMGQRLRHFIESSLRPDLRKGALANEHDLADGAAAEDEG